MSFNFKPLKEEKNYKYNQKPIYCNYCHYTYKKSGWSAHVGTNKHKNNIINNNNKCYQKLILFYIKK